MIAESLQNTARRTSDRKFVTRSKKIPSQPSRLGCRRATKSERSFRPANTRDSGIYGLSRSEMKGTVVGRWVRRDGWKGSEAHDAALIKFVRSVQAAFSNFARVGAFFILNRGGRVNVSASSNGRRCERFFIIFISYNGGNIVALNHYLCFVSSLRRQVELLRRKALSSARHPRTSDVRAIRRIWEDGDILTLHRLNSRTEHKGIRLFLHV